MMQVQIQTEIIGVKKFNDSIEGKTFNYCKIIATTQQDESKGNALGCSATEYEFGTHENFNRFIGKKFPMKAVLICEIVSSGKGQKFKVIDFKEEKVQ